MKKIVFALLIIPSLIFAQQKTATPGFVINGTITGAEEGSEVKIMNANDNSKVAASKLTKGKFILRGAVAEPILCYLVIGKEPPQYIFIENKKITVTGSKANLKNLKITGSSSQQDFAQFQKIFNPLIGSLNVTVGTLNKTPQGFPGFDALMKRYDSLKSIVQLEIDKFIKKRPKSFVSPFLLFVTAEMYDDPLLMEKRYNSLDTSIKNSMVGKNLFSYIQFNKVGAIGSTAQDFTQPDTTGVPVKLSSFRGKYVLVDFWASWCGPCRAENPNVVDNFKKFKEKNFTVLGVSLDKQEGRNNWIAAIQRDSLTWTHVSDLQFWNNAAAQLYHVQSIPFNILVDPSGTIVGKNLRGEALHNKLCELLGCN